MYVETILGCKELVGMSYFPSVEPEPCSQCRMGVMVGSLQDGGDGGKPAGWGVMVGSLQDGGDGGKPGSRS